MNIVDDRSEAGRRRVDVVFDTVCPWCYVGARRLGQALAARPEVRASVRWRPFLLNPDMPPEGMDREAYLSAKFGTRSQVRRTHDAILRAGASAGIAFAFERITRTPNAVNSHRFIRHAARWGKAAAAVEAVFRAYFADGRDIGEIATLVEIGRSLGLEAAPLEAHLQGQADVAWVYQENARAHALGINGVPVFVFDREHAISGAQAPEVLVRVLDAARPRSHDPAD